MGRGGAPPSPPHTLPERTGEQSSNSRLCPHVCLRPWAPRWSPPLTSPREHPHSRAEATVHPMASNTVAHRPARTSYRVDGLGRSGEARTWAGLGSPAWARLRGPVSRPGLSWKSLKD